MVSQGTHKYFLKHALILTDSFSFSDSSAVRLDSINTILGFIKITNPGPDHKLFVTYDYLNPSVPIIAGPIPSIIPDLDALTIKKKTAEIKSNYNSFVPEDILYTSGSFFRSMDINTTGGTELGGGLRFQLNGQIGSDIQVSGVITDESFPIQPEGNTKSLNEIDKVYLEVVHPRARVIAGDILFERNTKRFSSIRRSLIGLENKIEHKNWESSSVVGNLKGQYKRLEFKGNEGRQGPYYLTGKNGTKEIIIVAGSEKVWVNGNLLTRGANHDYNIDYSTGELFFTPEILIDFDTDILFEYQFSDFQFDRNLISTSIKRNDSRQGSLEISWIREKDQVSQDYKSSFEAGLLKLKGDDQTLLHSGELEESGDYFKNNGIYIYDPEHQAGQNKRYKVKFYLAENGLYQRQISKAGKIYYEYSDQPGRQFLDLYLPEKLINAPTGQDMVNIAIIQNIHENLEFQGDMSVSILDQNILSNLDDADNEGLAHNLKLKGSNLIFSKNGIFSFMLESWVKQKSFQVIQNDRPVLFNQNWNLSDTAPGNESMLRLSTDLQWNQKMGLDSHLQRYKLGGNSYNRIYNDMYYRGEFLHNLNVYINLVKTDKLFQQSGLAAEFLPGKFNPFINIDYEIDRDSVSYTQLSSGYKYEGKTSASAVSFGRRIDSAQLDSSKNNMSVRSRGYFAKLDWDHKSLRGWKQSLTVRKRILNYTGSETDKSFVLGRIVLNYYEEDNPFQVDMNVNLDETYSEERATVYDSVGTGLGYYRYDSQFNQYIRDEKGAYVSRNVITGKKAPSVKFNSTQRMRIDFSKMKFKKLNDLDYQLNFKNDYQGRIMSVNKIFKASLNHDQVLTGRYSLRQELDYFPRYKGRRWRTWWQLTHALNGFDPRGPQLTQKSEWGNFMQGDYWNNMQPFLKSQLREINISAAEIYGTDRNFRGYSAELGLKGEIKGDWQWSFSVEKINDAGNSLQDEHFEANSHGIKTKLLRFIGKKSRLETESEWYKSINKGNFLPPEALRGLALGETLKITFRGSTYVGQNLSVNFNLLYLNDNRYDNYIDMRAEIRAYF